MLKTKLANKKQLEEAENVAYFYQESIKQLLKKSKSKHAKELLKPAILYSLKETFRLAFLAGRGVVPKNVELPKQILK